MVWRVNSAGVLDGTVPMGDDDGLLAGLQRLPGFDNETFIQAMAVCEEGLSVLWRRSTGGVDPRP